MFSKANIMKHFEFNYRRNNDAYLSGRATLYKIPRYDRILDLEYNAPSHHSHIYLKQNDEALTFSIASPIAALWVSFPPRFKNCYKDIFYFSIHDNAFWWSFWNESHFWSSKTPKWKDGCFHLDDFFLGKTTYTTKNILERVVSIPMPEKAYRAVATLFESVWKRPRWFAEKLTRVEFEMQEPVPIPGKGENSYDCDDDAVFSMTLPAETIEEGIGKFVGDVLSTRMRRIGKHFWDRTKK